MSFKKKSKEQEGLGTTLPVTWYTSMVLFHVEHLSGTELEH